MRGVLGLSLGEGEVEKPRALKRGGGFPLLFWRVVLLQVIVYIR